ncbi:hypothetical protein AA313_de0202335 [Arthrobotrys entomopaga]|nr:hypothetical protein AA313_de0202335 [Arthrobotrys entomopaga]
MEQFLPANISNTYHQYTYLQSQNILPPVHLNSSLQVQYCPAIEINMPAPLLAQGNEEAWLTATSSYDSLDWQKKLTSQVRSFIRENASWLSLSSPPTSEVKVLDYACGPGVVSLAILPYTTHLTGIDVNPQQVEEYNRRVALASLPETHIKAETADLFIDPSAIPSKFSEEGYNNFDYAFCSAALHHVDDPALGVKRLAERVKANGGRVVIIEFMLREGDEEGGHGSEERKKENAEYRVRSHDNRHLVEGAAGGSSQHHHHHHHQHGEGHGHHHHHHHTGEGDGESGEAKREHGHGPHGFKVEVMEGYFKDAGLVNVQSLVMPEKVTLMGFGDFEIFMMQGRRA